MTQTHLFGTKDHSYDLEVHGPVFPKAAQNVVTRGRAWVSDQEVSVPLKQRLCCLQTSQHVMWVSWARRFTHVLTSHSISWTLCTGMWSNISTFWELQFFAFLRRVRWKQSTPLSCLYGKYTGNNNSFVFRVWNALQVFLLSSLPSLITSQLAWRSIKTWYNGKQLARLCVR